MVRRSVPGRPASPCRTRSASSTAPNVLGIGDGLVHLGPGRMERTEQLHAQIVALEPLRLRDDQLQTQPHELVADRLRARQQPGVPTQGMAGAR